jgi:hypothetical protein
MFETLRSIVSNKYPATQVNACPWAGPFRREAVEKTIWTDDRTTMHRGVHHQNLTQRRL